MSLLPQQLTIKQYLGDGSTTIFIYPFFIPLDGDIQVFVTPEGETPVPQFDIKILNVDYTVQGSGDINGGTITFISGAPGNNSIVSVVRNVADSIDTEFSEARNIRGDNLDNAFEREMLCIQQNTSNFALYGLQYVINDLIPDAPVGFPAFSYSNQVPRLPNNYIWVGQNGGVVAALLEQNPDWSTLRTQLLSEAVGTNGCSIIGYNDPNNSDAPQQLKTFLDDLPAYILDIVLPYIKGRVPPGTMLDFGGTSAPDGFLLCDGTAVSRTTYAELFTAIGTTWGVGNGTTTFNIPDLRRRNTIGSGGVATSPDFTGTTTGSYGGEEVHTMGLSEIASHTHTGHLVYPKENCGGGGTPVVGQPGGTDQYNFTTDATGSSTPFNEMPPGAVVTKIIKT